MIAPLSSRPMTWNVFLPMSMPIVAMTLVLEVARGMGCSLFSQPHAGFRPREARARRATGAGMSEKQIAAALEPFADIDAWAKSGAGETEFGLPWTKALAEANHAQFRIKSAPGAGTLVEIAFPSNRTVAN